MRILADMGVSVSLISRLTTVLERSGDALEKGAVVVVEESRHRVRYLPIGQAGSPESEQS